ncbi:MAG: hypothetical protein IJ302_00975 [Clostridia bacterium]|nr:hypothetical protein [Clostridia bacterium]
MDTGVTAELLYRFFCAFPGISETVPLGFEAEAAGTAGGAVFAMEPARSDGRRYINGGGRSVGSCVISRRVPDADTVRRLELAAWFSALETYVRVHGNLREGDPASAQVLRVRPSSSAARLRMTRDGAVWELRFSVEIYERMEDN